MAIRQSRSNINYKQLVDAGINSTIRNGERAGRWMSQDHGMVDRCDIMEMSQRINYNLADIALESMRYKLPIRRDSSEKECSVKEMIPRIMTIPLNLELIWDYVR